jgi:glycerol-3-phosphate cytidylyltransferase
MKKAKLKKVSKKGKKVGVTVGAFDLCHAGHMLVFKECKGVCDYLIVGLQTDPSIDRPDTKNKPVMSQKERRIILEGIKYIDEIFEYKTEAELYNILKKNKHGFDVRIIGADWKGKPYTGHDLPIPMHFNSRNHSYSTTELRRRIHEAELLKSAFGGSPKAPKKKNSTK